MNREVLNVCRAVGEAGGRAIIVGGWVRDYLLGIESKDFDIEVYGLEPRKLRAVLETIGQVNTVGEKFAVYKLAFKSQDGARFEIDVSIPRRESKTGRGHRAFFIEGDPLMTFEEAARRRDFTINAILYDPLTNEIVDPFGGVRDLNERVLRAVAADTFIDDSLRVLRAVQFAARFEMTVDPKTAELCRSIDLTDLPEERIWGEMDKLLTLADRPSIGLDLALALGVLEQLFPEIRALAENESENSPYVSAFDITKRALDEAVKLAGGLPKQKRVTVMLACLCHELGKPLRAIAGNEARSSTEAAVEQARSVIKRLGLRTIAGYDVRSQVLALVRERQKPLEFYRGRDTVSDGDFRRLAQRVDIDLLSRVAKAYALARGTPPDGEEWFIESARALGVEHGPPAPLLQGRHLIEAGIAPGPEMGATLRRVYDLQLDGKVTTLEEALRAALRIN
ncbi:MAG TPA: polynucleotide adenylyltransferase [Blastocatellia bacterium]|nr:polynucleotide adenylyltransferase [Blastocatellia bacterium]